MDKIVTLALRIPRNSEITPEAAQTFLSTLANINSVSALDKILGKKEEALALEIVLTNQQIKFMISCHANLRLFIEAQLKSNYPLVIIEEIEDPLAESSLEVYELKLKRGNFYPIATYDKFVDIDPLSSVLTVLSKSEPSETAIIQIALRSVGNSWQRSGNIFAEQGGGKKEDGTYAVHPDQNIIKEKISYPGFGVSVRLAANTKKTLSDLVASFNVFSRSDGNIFAKKSGSIFGSAKALEQLIRRKVAGKEILNISEIATLWHLPSVKIKISNIAWGTAVLSEPPENLPVSEIDEEEKQKINFFGKTEFKNKEVIFGIKDKDRLRHIWTVGKTGTGKSTMIANMAIDDIKKGRGIGIIDPHGDLCEDILDYIPSGRINDTIYFNPADRDYPIILNPLEVNNQEEAELVVSGLMSIFTKVWANVWSARMEYILRNSFMTLTYLKESTFEDVLRLLSNKDFRARVVGEIDDKNLIQFWQEEFEKMPAELQKEAIAPIQNKVGQFVTSPLIRRIIGKPKSSISIGEIMDQKKIFLANLSQGRLGEDNAQLLGAMLITKFQVAAMRRVDTPKEERVPYYLFVDEFQNFATSSFIKILSEARKYGLGLILANQYMGQIPLEVQKAIMGNAGTIISFSVGAEDAEIIHKEFAEDFSQNDLINLRNFQIAIKLMIDWHSTRPFLATTLPLPTSKNQNREKVLNISRERWAKKVS